VKVVFARLILPGLCSCWNLVGRAAPSSGPSRGGYSGGQSRAAASSSSSGGGGAAANPGNVCRFGRGCHREGCYYSHPEGRDVDDGMAPAGGISAGPGAQRGGARAAAPISPTSGRSDFDPEDWEEEPTEEEFFAAQGGVQVCECCNGKPLECQTPGCKAAGKCGCTLGETVEDDQEDDSLRDEWFPAYRDCPCCAGTIYRCKKLQDDCVSGNCYCSLEKAKPVATQ
jgi:hypothetical protein